MPAFASTPRSSSAFTQMPRSRVALYGRFPFNRAILAPVRDALDPGVDALLTGDATAVVAHRPHVLLVTAHDRLEYFRHHLPTTQIGNVRHGLVSKAVLARQPRRTAARYYDFLCAGPDDSGPDVFARAGLVPGEVWRTGYPQLDPLHRRDAPPALGFDPTRPTVLYAPTWNLGLTSATVLGDQVIELIRAGAPDANVIIKPHPVIREWHSGWMRSWRRLASATPNVLLVEDTHADVTPFMLAADLMVSDASSVIFEFLALDRPIVLVLNPRHRADPAFDPDDIIWRWRDVGVEVRRAADLPGAIAAELADPGRNAHERARYADILFGDQTDGQNALRIARRTSVRSLELAAGGAGAEVALGPARRRPALPRWAIGDLARAAWQRPPIRRAIVGPLERLRLLARARALQAGTLRGPNGRPLPPALATHDGTG
jgi:hypothetical protein